MARTALVVGAFDLAVYGTCSFVFTDDGGPATAPLSSAVYDHDDLTDASGLTTITAASLGAQLESEISGVSTNTITLAFSRATGKYTITNTDGAVFSIAWTTNAATIRLGKLLGFTANSSGALSYTSTHVPMYCMVPAKGAMARYPGPIEEKGHVSSVRSSASQPYRLGPAAIPVRTSWDFEFEPKSAVDRVYRTASNASHLYTWEQMWTDFGRSALLPLVLHTEGVDGLEEIFAFDLANPEYDETTHKPSRPNDHVRWTVSISAHLRQSTADATLPARTIA